VPAPVMIAVCPVMSNLSNTPTRAPYRRSAGRLPRYGAH
jgi:hypothetical protein